MCDPIQSIATRLRGLREALELTQEEVAASCNLPVEQYREMESGKAKEHDDSSDFEAVAQVVHELYTYRDEVLLVLTKAQGSSMEHMPDRLVDQMDEHNAFICEAMCKAYHVPMVEQSVVHWMSHSQIDMFIFMVTHIDDEEEALRFAEKGVKYLLAGWYGLIRS